MRLQLNERVNRSGFFGSSDDVGQFLAQTRLDEGGWSEYFEDVSDIDRMCRIPGGTCERDDMIAKTALVLENAKRWMMSMDEATRSLTLSGFQDHLFPIIRTGFPQNPIFDLVSVQPMTRRIGQVFFMHYKIGQTKGQYAAGQRLFDALAGYAGGYHYSDEYVDNEDVGVMNSATVPAFTLTYAGGENGGGIRPGTVQFHILASTGVDEMILQDNGNGVFVAIQDTASDFTSGTINYSTGAVALVTANDLTANHGFASYEYDSEGSTNLPMIDVEIASSPVTARRRALRFRYSTESAQDYQAEFGQNVDDTILAGIAATITTEQAREVIADLWSAAGAPFSSFSITHSPTTVGYSKREHFADMQHPLAEAINQLYQETQRVYANWMIVDTKMQSVLNAIGAPHFAQWNEAPKDDMNLGVKFIGTWEGRIRVYVDSLLGQYPGASAYGNALLGYKGNDFRDAGYVWAPYRQVYITPSTTLDDFVTRKAMASRVGRKLINARMFRRFELTA